MPPHHSFIEFTGGRMLRLTPVKKQGISPGSDNGSMLYNLTSYASQRALGA